MKVLKNKSLRPSQFVLTGDQLLIIFGLLSALFANYRLLSITVFPLHTIFYRITVHLFLAVAAWIIFGINHKVIRYFSSKDYLNLIFILALIHFFSAMSGTLFPEKHHLKPIDLKSKEGLALLNGTQFMGAFGVHIILKSFNEQLELTLGIN